MDKDFTLKPDILQTATGSILGDIDQLQNAVYGREVRASIAEALYLLYKTNYEIVAGFESVLQQFQLLSDCMTTVLHDLDALKRRLGMIEYPFPDADGDGQITATDVELILEYAANKSAGNYDAYPTEQEKWRAFAEEKGLTNSTFPDANADGVVDASDAAIVSTFAAEVGAGNYTNDAEGFREFMLDYDNAIFGTGISGFRVMTQKQYDQIAEPKSDIQYNIIPDAE